MQDQALVESKNETTMKLSELVLDYELYPRARINPQNVARLKESLQAGDVLPPLLVDESTRTLIDGFHRYQAYHELYGEDHECDVVLRRYADRGAMLIEIGRTNARHGQPLSVGDKERFVLMAQRMGLYIDEVAGSLAITKEKVRKLYQRRITAAGRSGEEAFAGDPPAAEASTKKTAPEPRILELTRKRMEKKAKETRGSTIGFHASRVLQGIKLYGEDFRDNEQVMKMLVRLQEVLAEYLDHRDESYKGEEQ